MPSNHPTAQRVLSVEDLSTGANGMLLVDRQTSSIWNVLGRSTHGPFAGRRLGPIDAHDSFWFDWAAFHPHTRLWHP